MEPTPHSDEPTPSADVSAPPTVLVVNAHARSGQRRLGDAVKSLEAAGLVLREVLPVRRPERLPELVREAVRAGAGRVIVGGGDGTLSAAAGPLVGTHVELGVLPLGTGNDFARNLGVPTRLEEAAEVIARGVTAEIDVGRAGDTPFLNAASLGVSAQLTRRMKPSLKRVLGKLAYPVAALGELPELEPFRLHLRAAGDERVMDALQVVVGNGRFHGAGNVVAPQASLDDRLLDVYVIVPPGGEVPQGFSASELGQWDKVRVLARVASRLRSGGHLQDPNVVHLATQALELWTEPAQEVDVDGELLGHTPLRLEVVPRALRVRVPAEGRLAVSRRARSLTRRRGRARGRGR